MALDPKAIRERAEKATPGPWERVTLFDGAGVMAGEVWVVRFDDDYGTGAAQGHDSLFIAHAREDIPALLAEVERLEADVKEWVSVYNDENIKVRNLEALAKRLYDALLDTRMVDRDRAQNQALRDYKVRQRAGDRESGPQQAKGQPNQSAILKEILKEREYQDIKWGEQNHHPFVWLAILGEEKGEADKAVLEATYGQAPWSHYRNELIQTAAVALAAIESLDRNGRP